MAAAHALAQPHGSQLKVALALNRRLFKAHYLKEQIEQLWTYTYHGAALRFFIDWLLSLASLGSDFYVSTVWQESQEIEV